MEINFSIQSQSSIPNSQGVKEILSEVHLTVTTTIAYDGDHIIRTLRMFAWDEFVRIEQVPSLPESAEGSLNFVIPAAFTNSKEQAESLTKYLSSTTSFVLAALEAVDAYRAACNNATTEKYFFLEPSDIEGDRLKFVDLQHDRSGLSMANPDYDTEAQVQIICNKFNLTVKSQDMDSDSNTTTYEFNEEVPEEQSEEFYMFVTSRKNFPGFRSPD